MAYGRYGGHQHSSSQHVRHPAWRKTYLWFFCLAGSGICIAVLAAALAPAGANHVQPAGGVLGSLGLAFSIWLGWCAHRVRLRGREDAQPLESAASAQASSIEAARLELKRRHEALAILHRDPALARQLRIGRPDLPRTFDDGGLVDVNHVPAPLLAAVPGVGQALAGKIVSTRELVGGFRSLADLEVTLNLTPGTVSQLQDRLVFVPWN